MPKFVNEKRGSIKPTANPYKPEITDQQEANEKAINQLVNLGGGLMITEHGKKPVAGNVNLKPSEK